MTTVNVHYIVQSVDEAITFYTQYLSFSVELHPGPGFARLARGDLRLLLSAQGGQGGAAQTMPDGRRPEPGGWNRIQIEVDNLAGLVDILRKDGVHFRNDIVNGNGGKQILLDDSSGPRSAQRATEK
jgi:catechol 2,3-dioxygenase-like lactoylglutathione lyase family enzyme